MVETWNNAIFCCPECLKKNKIRRFRRVKNLNIHLTIKHDTKYKIVIADGAARAVLRTNRGRLKVQSLLIAQSVRRK